MKFMKILSTLCSFSLTFNVLSAFNTCAIETPLSPYLSILTDFNEEHGTSYQLATEVQLSIINETSDDMIEFICSMNESEFYNYLNDAYLNDIEKNLDTEQVPVNSIDNINTQTNLTSTEFTILPQASYTGTQHYYYRGSTTESFYITASWSYGDGYYRYSTSLLDIGYTATEGCYPYYAPYNYSYAFANFSRELDCTFNCTKYVSKYLTQGNYIISVTFEAGGGNIWGSVQI